MVAAVSIFGWIRKPKRAQHVDHAAIREDARLQRVAADAQLLLDNYYKHGWLSRRRVKSMGQRRWRAAYRLLKVSGLLDPASGHPRTRSRERAIAEVRREARLHQERILSSNGRYTCPF